MTTPTAALSAEVDGLRIAYEWAGAGTPVVVFIHGAFGTRSHFDAQLEHLARRHRAIALDLRGHGHSEIPETDIHIRDFARDVLAVCHAANVERAVFCGHSIGGVVALEVAAARPDLTAGVVLLDAALLFPESVRAQALRGLVPTLQTDAWVDALCGYFVRTFGPHDSPALKAKVMDEISRSPRHLAAPLMRDIMSSDFAAQLSAVDCPILHIHAKAPAELDRLRQIKPDALMGVIVGSGHYLMMEVPDQVNAMLDRFLHIVTQPS